MAPIVDSRIKSSNVRIPMLQTESKVKAFKHNSLVGPFTVGVLLLGQRT